MKQRSVLVVLFEDVLSLDVSGPMEVFAGASRIPGISYELRTASLTGAPVRCSNGLTLVPDGALADADVPDMLLVAGGSGTRTPDPALIDWLRENAPHAGQLVSVCSGACCSPRPGSSTATA